MIWGRKTNMENKELVSKPALIPYQYVKIGGVQSTIHGPEIGKMYKAIREFEDVLMNFKYLGKYFCPEAGTYDLIHDSNLRGQLEKEWKDICDIGNEMLACMNCYLRGNQYSKAEQEIKLLKQEGF